MRFILTNRIIMGILEKTKEKAKVNSNGVMDKFMMVNGRLIKNKAVAYGKDQIMFRT
jgi:hypothetical protein